MGCCLEMRDRLEVLEKWDVVENRRNSGQELGIIQSAVPGCSKLTSRPNWAKVLLFHVERPAISWPGLRGFHVEHVPPLPVPPNSHTIALNLSLKNIFDFCHTG